MIVSTTVNTLPLKKNDIFRFWIVLKISRKIIISIKFFSLQNIFLTTLKFEQTIELLNNNLHTYIIKISFVKLNK